MKGLYPGSKGIRIRMLLFPPGFRMLILGNHPADPSELRRLSHFLDREGRGRFLATDARIRGSKLRSVR
jgi:hypothetical protein